MDGRLRWLNFQRKINLKQPTQHRNIAPGPRQSPEKLAQNDKQPLTEFAITQRVSGPELSRAFG